MRAASLSETSLKTTSNVLPYGFDATPAELRKAATLSASAARLKVGSVFWPMSTPLAQVDACGARITFGAIESRSLSRAQLKPWNVLGRALRPA